MSAARAPELIPLAEAAERASCGKRTIRRWITAGILTRHEGPRRPQGGRAPLLLAVHELETHLGHALAPASGDAPPTPQDAPKAPHGAPTVAQPAEETLAARLREKLKVANLAIDSIREQLEEEPRNVPGRTIAAMSVLIKTATSLEERIAELDAQQPSGPRTEEEAQRLLRLALEGWEDQALEMAFEVYRARHTNEMQKRVCRITVDDGQGHRAVWTEAGWLKVAS